MSPGCNERPATEECTAIHDRMQRRDFSASEGDRFSGEVVSGNDWQSVRTDSDIKFDVRLLLKTTDGALIVMTCAPDRPTLSKDSTRASPSTPAVITSA